MATNNNIQAIVNPYARAVQHNPTAVLDSTAIPLFNKVMQDTIQFNQIALADLEGENSIMLMSTFVNRLASNPPLSSRGKPYSASTLKEAVAKVVFELKRKFQRHTHQELFPDAEVTTWKTTVARDRNRLMMEGEEEDDTFKGTFPLPICQNVRTRLFPSQDFPDDDRRTHSRNTDLKMLCGKLIRKERFEANAKIVLTYKAVGRGGEIKFVSYQRMYYDPTYKMIITPWFQRKNLKSTPVGIAPDFSNPETCPFFALGCYWACSSGLMRNDGVGIPRSAEERKANYVFQDFHKVQDRSVAEDMTSIIRSEIVPQIAKFYSVKSLRMGSMTHLTWDTNVTYAESNALGGWAMGSNAEWYLWVYVVAIIPAALSLAGYPDPRVLPYMPNHDVLDSDVHPDNRVTNAAFSAFVTCLFPSNLPDFQPPNGRHRKMAIVVATTMVMHFSYFYQQFGHQHQYISTMITATINSQLATDLNSALIKLQEWSTAIKTDFLRGNMMYHNSDGGSNISADRTIIQRRHWKDEMASINSNVARVVASQNELRAQLLHHQQQQQQLNTVCQRLMEQQAEMMRQNQMLMNTVANLTRNPQFHPNPTTPGTNTTTAAPNNNNAGPINNNNVAPQNNNNAAPRPAQPRNPPPQRTPPSLPATNPTQPPPAPTAQRAPVTPHASDRGSLATDRLLGAQLPQKRRRGEQNRSETVEQILNAMYRDPNEHSFKSIRERDAAFDEQTTWVHSNVFKYREKTAGKIKLGLQVIDAVWTSDERDTILNKRLNSIEAFRLHASVAKRVVETLHLLQDKTPASTKPSSKTTSSLLGVANKLQSTTIYKEKQWEKYIPDWSKNGEVQASTTLTARAEAIKQSIRADQHLRRNST
jgi:hypothetical protein